MEKPLNVRVAEALGWRWKLSPTGGCRFLCPPTSDNPYRTEPDTYADAALDVRVCHDAYRYVYNYDTDWRATGPELERLKIRVTYSSQGHAYVGHPSIDAETRRDHEVSILPAVCRAILALDKAGKL